MSIYATKTGLWSDPTVWNTGVIPIATDVVRPNNFIVTMDVDATVAEIRNDAGGGAVANGRFIINSGVSITATTITVGQAAVRLITHSGVGTASITGTITNTNLNARNLAIENASTGILNINGNILFPQNNTTIATEGFIENSLDGIINITGTVNGNVAGANRAQCVVNVSTGTVNIVANVNSPATAGALFFTVVNVSTGTITINGNITTTASTAIDNRSTGTITVNGNVTHNSGSPILNVSGTITIVGNLTNNYSGSASSLASALSQSGSGTINVVGDVIAGNISNASSWTINNTSNGTVNVTGNVTGNSIGGTTEAFNTCINNAANGTVNVTGTVTNGTSQPASLNPTLQAIRNASTGIVNVIGNCIGTIATSPSHQSAAVINVAGGVVNVTGNAIGGSTGNAIQNIATGTINLNGNAIGGTSWFAIEGVSSAGNTIIEKAVYSNLGQSATAGFIKFKDSNPQVEILNVSNNKVTLFDVTQVSGLMPSISDVRLGVIYSNGSLNGILAVPNPNNVLQGVATDNTVGTLLMTPADFWNYLISNGFTTGSIGERLKNASTVDTTGAQVAGFLV